MRTCTERVTGAWCSPTGVDSTVLEGSAHAQFMFEADQAERVMREILRFLSEKN